MEGMKIAKIYPSNWRRDTVGFLSLEEEGLHWRCCVYTYDTGRPIPLNEAEASRTLCVNHNQYRKVMGQLVAKGKMLRTNEGYIDGRVRDELMAYWDGIKLRSEAAKRRQADRRVSAVTTPLNKSNPPSKLNLPPQSLGGSPPQSPPQSTALTPLVDQVEAMLANGFTPPVNSENLNKINNEIQKSGDDQTCAPVVHIREHAGARAFGINLSSRVEDLSPPSPPQSFSQVSGGDVDVDDLVHVNCKTISGPGFVLDLKAVEYDASLHGISVPDAKKIAEAQARHWAANKQIPPNPGGMLRGIFAGHRNRHATYVGKTMQIARAGSQTDDLLRRPDDLPDHIWQRRLKQLLDEGRVTQDQAIGAGMR
jgi:uncharacterized protein YdaU (DUF1376 family)